MCVDFEMLSRWLQGGFKVAQMRFVPAGDLKCARGGFGIVSDGLRQFRMFSHRLG